MDTRIVRRRGLATVLAAVAVVTLAAGSVVAAQLDDVEPYPRIVMLARNDVPFDSLGAGAVAAQLGAPVVITPPTRLSDAARDAIAAADPEVVLVAGGTGAVSSEVAEAAAAACDPTCTIDRRGGAGRDDTAALLADVPGNYGITAPVVAGTGQVVGDVHVGGTVAADAITVQSSELVDGLNADQVDGVDATDLLRFPLVLHGRGDPRISDNESADVTPVERGTYVDFDVPPGSASVIDVYIDLPGPAVAGGRPVALTAIELCYRVYGTSDSITSPRVVTQAEEPQTTEWPLDLGYNVANGLPRCVPLDNPPIVPTGPATLHLEWHQNETVGNSLQIFGVTTTWEPTGS